MTEKMIIDAYCRIRKIDQAIPDEVLDFMKDSAIEKLRVKVDSNINNMNHNCTLSDVFIQISKYEDTIHLPTFIRLRSSYYDEREKLKTEIWQLIDSDERFTYERTSEIFITKGLKKNEKLLDFYPKERHGSNNEGSYISHLVVRKNFK